MFYIEAVVDFLKKYRRGVDDDLYIFTTSIISDKFISLVKDVVWKRVLNINTDNHVLNRIDRSYEYLRLAA